MSSMRPMTGTGLKKCTPAKRAASGAAWAKRVIGIELVLDARIACGPNTLPTSPKMARLMRSEEHTSELQSLMRISYAVFCLKKKTTIKTQQNNNYKRDNAQQNK